MLAVNKVFEKCGKITLEDTGHESKEKTPLAINRHILVTH